MRKYLKEILYLLGSDKYNIPKIIGMYVIASILDVIGLGIIAPYLAIVIDPTIIYNDNFSFYIEYLGLPNNNEKILIILGLILVFVFFIKVSVIMFINYTVIKFSQQQQVKLRSTLMDLYQNLPFSIYLHRNSSEYINSIQNLTATFSNQVILLGLQTIGNILVALVIFIMLAWSDFSTFLMLVSLMTAFIIGYDRLFRQKLRAYGRCSNDSLKSTIQGIHEGMDGLKEVRILGVSKYFYDKVCNSAKKYGDCQVGYASISSAPRYLIEFFLVTFIVLIIVFRVSVGKDLSEIIPILGVFGIAAMRIMPIATGISNSLIQLRFGRDAVSRLYKDSVSIKSNKIISKQISEINPPFFKVLSLKNVSYCYDKYNQTVLDEISITIKSGESIGIIGGSGSGKTTLIDLMLGLLEAKSGEIDYNGEPMIENISNWRGQIAYLPQQVFIIDSTLKNNVALGISEDNIDEELLNQALGRAQLLELVNSLPKGLETILGERGVRLSGGQRQRIALARAFYHERSVLIMDEATSALDYKTEREIVKEVGRLKGEVTMIIIAHRISTLQHCDRIYEIQNGRVVKSGEYKQFI